MRSGDLSFLTATVSCLRARAWNLHFRESEISVEISRRSSRRVSSARRSQHRFQTSGLPSAGVCVEHSSALAKRGTAYLHNADNLLTAHSRARNRAARFSFLPCRWRLCLVVLICILLQRPAAQGGFHVTTGRDASGLWRAYVIFS